MAKRKKKPDPIQIETPLPEQEAKGTSAASGCTTAAFL